MSPARASRQATAAAAIASTDSTDSAATQVASRAATPTTLAKPSESSPEVHGARQPQRPFTASLRRLTAAGVIACAINGGAAFLLVNSDAAHVRAVARAESEDLREIQRIVTDLPTSAASTTPADGQSFFVDLENGSGRLTDSATRAASGPAQFTGDVGRWRELSSAYTRYAALLHAGRSSTGSARTNALAEAEKVKTDRIDPVLSRLTSENAARSEGAQTSAVLTIGLLGVTSLATLIALLGGSRWLALRTKRVLNPGLAGALITSGAVSAYAFSQLSESAPTTPGAGPLLLVGGLAASGLVWLGIDQRLKEYR